jgi:hypothetical protein
MISLMLITSITLMFPIIKWTIFIYLIRRKIMSKDKAQFTSDELKAWPYRDSKGRPMPNPEELKHFVPAPEIDEDLNDPDEDDE